MATNRQTTANRQNAKKSTDPRTKSGKKLVSRNALKHGLRAAQLLIPDESPADFEAFRKRALDSLKPVGFLEIELAETIINTRWRLRRCERIEAGRLGGGKHVMEEIANTSRERFAMMLETNVRPEDRTRSQLLHYLLAQRNEAHFEERRCFDPGFKHCFGEDRFEGSAKSGEEGRRTDTPSKREYHKKCTESLPFSDVSDQDLLDEFLRTREEERQKNPLSYDVALGFRKAAGDLNKLAGYEGHLYRKLDRAIREFQRLQDARKAEAARTAKVIDVRDLNEKES